jgi:hypothetical protein
MKEERERERHVKRRTTRCDISHSTSSQKTQIALVGKKSIDKRWVR